MTATADTKTVRFDFSALEGDAPLYCQFAGQFNEQPAFFSLDLRDGEAGADYDANIGGGVPESVWHGVVRRYPVTARLSRAAVESLAKDLAPLFQRVLNDACDEWDGSNMVGVLGEDARDAEEEIARLLDDAEGDLDVWDAFDYVTGTGEVGLSVAWPAGMTLEQAAENARQQAEIDGITFADDVSDALVRFAQREYDHRDDADTDGGLTPEQMAVIRR